MANIILKNASGIPQKYSGVTKIKLPTVEGGTVEFSEGSSSAVIKALIEVENTPVPNTGNIEKVYFNTNLSIEETDTILATLSYQPLDANNTNTGVYYVVVNAAKNILLAVLKDNTNNTYNITDFATFETIYSSVYFEDGEDKFTGWYKDIPNYFEINDNVVSYLEGISIGTQNNKLSKIFSIAPFVPPTAEEIPLEGEYDGNIAEVNDLNGKWQSVTVPNNNHIENVYFNTKLDDSEIISILSQVTYIQTPFLDYPLYPILCTESGSPVVIAVKLSNTEYEIDIITDIVNETYERIYSSYLINGVKGFYKNNYKINAVAINNYNGLEVGVENDKLSLLVSTIPFTFIEPKITTIDLLQYIKNKKIPLKLKINTGNNATISTGTATGTSIPGSGYVDTVYFNTDLTPEEILILSNDLATETNVSGEVQFPIILWDTYGLMLTYVQEDGITMSGIVKVNLDTGDIESTEDIIFAYSSDASFNESLVAEAGFIGWNPIYLNNTNSIAINTAIVDMSSFMGDSYPDWCFAVDKLSCLISSTPITSEEDLILEGKYDGSMLNIKRIPEGEIVGTTVLGSGPLKTVYFNTSMSIEETNEIIKSLSYVVTDVIPWNAAVVAADSTLTTGLLVHYYPGPDAETQGHYEIQAVTSEGIKGIYVWNNIPAEEAEGQEGWKGIESLELNIDDNVLDAMGPSLGYTNQNEAVSKLISSTPYKLVGAGIIDLKPYIENKQIPLEIKVTGAGGKGTLAINKGWSGTVVPNNGNTVSTIYFNTKLSKDEVINILTDITYFPISTEMSANYVFCNWTTDTGSDGGAEGIVGIARTLPNKYEIIISKANTQTVIFDSEAGGWLNDISSYTFNLASKNVYSYFPVGDDNVKLSGLISTSPFIEQDPEVVNLNGAYKSRELTITENNTEINVWDKSNPLNNKEIVTSVNVKIPESSGPLWYISLQALDSSATNYKYKFKGIYTGPFGSEYTTAALSERVTQSLKWLRRTVNPNATSITDKFMSEVHAYDINLHKDWEFSIETIGLENVSFVNKSTTDSGGNEITDTWYLFMDLNSFNLLDGSGDIYFVFEGTSAAAPTFPVFISVPSFSDSDILSHSLASTRAAKAIGSIIMTTQYTPGTFAVQVAKMW